MRLFNVAHLTRQFDVLVVILIRLNLSFVESFNVFTVFKVVLGQLYCLMIELHPFLLAQFSHIKRVDLIVFVPFVRFFLFLNILCSLYVVTICNLNDSLIFHLSFGCFGLFFTSISSQSHRVLNNRRHIIDLLHTFLSLFL